MGRCTSTRTTECSTPTGLKTIRRSGHSSLIKIIRCATGLLHRMSRHKRLWSTESGACGSTNHKTKETMRMLLKNRFKIKIRSQVKGHVLMVNNLKDKNRE